MPNIWTHIIYARQLAQKTNLDISPFKNAYYLGAQGPDPFFYYNFLPWIKDKSAVKIGSEIHKKNCGKFLIEMVRYLKNNKNDELLKLYIYGFISHHLLDRNTHPYIIYKSSEKDNKHQLLETIIDTILTKEFLGIETWETPVYREIDLGENMPQQLIELIVFLVNTVHHNKAANLGEVFNKSYRDMLAALKLFHDPSGIKNKLLLGKITPFSHRKSFPEKDYLNTRHQVWYHPVDREESRESFYEMFERAEKEGIAVFGAISSYLEDSQDILQLEKLLGNISYETGRDCGQDYELKYFEPIV